MRWLLLEPYYGGSHRHLADGLRERLSTPPLLWTLPARKWKWRMRGAAAHFARRWRQSPPEVDGILCTSLMNAAELRGLLPSAARSLPLILYCHENQLRYPIQHFDERDHHLGWSNVLSALAADRILWNSAYNRDSFLEDLEALARKMPDARPGWAVEEIRERSQILPVPLDVRGLIESSPRDRRQGPCRILWNHRWEFDKGPERLHAALDALVGEGLDFRVVLLGQRFETRPPQFDRLARRLGPRLEHVGYAESQEEYRHWLSRCDVALSTALHEFQGLAVIEAAACGAVPLVPDALAYPEIWPEPYRWPEPDGLVGALRERIVDRERWRGEDPRPHCLRFDWSEQLPAWESLLASPG